ncbi:Tyrosine-protein phosphatase non-receptor type 20 [Panicum miliaceum]|uniref:Tyrosine-protein phosphatase non-receptor type 20 n=1 Tax=Panicum miliaceum TaxID=4540 RepID=A0A3L6Q0Z0_PANMI|nr:Tyrosine-protein phosphatase non-receptor type 20 [Panicum miliaceum]
MQSSTLHQRKHRPAVAASRAPTNGTTSPPPSRSQQRATGLVGTAAPTPNPSPPAGTRFAVATPPTDPGAPRPTHPHDATAPPPRRVGPLEETTTPAPGTGTRSATVAAPPDASGTRRAAAPAAFFPLATTPDPVRCLEPGSFSFDAAATGTNPPPQMGAGRIGGGRPRPAQAVAVSSAPTPQVAPFDPLDPDADPPRPVLSKEQVWRCEIARQVLRRKIDQQPDVITAEFKSLPARLGVVKNTELFTAARDNANWKRRNRHRNVLPLPRVSSIEQGLGQDYGDFNVKITKTRYDDPLELRSVKIQRKESDRVHSLLHIRYSDWPDHGVPVDSTAVLQIINRLYRIPRDHPIVAHCSFIQIKMNSMHPCSPVFHGQAQHAGIGRAGSTITILNTIERILRGEWSALELVETVKKFRNQRVGMVEQEEQYKFCYRAVADELKQLILNSEH